MSDLDDLKPAKDFAASNRHIFKTDGSWEWFVRKNHERLINSGQYFPRKGRAGALVGPKIGEVVMEILRDESSAA